MFKYSQSLLVTALFLLCANVNGQDVAPLDLARDIRMPAGFSIEQIAEVPNARAMAWGDDGTLFVSTMLKGQVFAVTGALDGNPKVWPIGKKLKIPNGIAYRDGALYVSETTRLIKYSNIQKNLADPGTPEVVVDGLPAGKSHSWKYIDFGPDGQLYMSIGSPCNVCNEPDYGLIVRMNADGSDRETYARGIRNSVGFNWHPVTKELWFTDNNRDMLGDDEPPGELNHAPASGGHYGFPFCHGTDTVEPERKLAALGSCADAIPPAQELGPHVAPLGIEFYTGSQFPAEYHNQLLIAEHGSWNRSEKIGYRVTLVRLAEDGRTVTSYETFADGWLKGDEVSGRPVDLLMAPDGSLLMSDDRRGVIYRISYQAPTDSE